MCPGSTVLNYLLVIAMLNLNKSTTQSINIFETIRSLFWTLLNMFCVDKVYKHRYSNGNPILIVRDKYIFKLFIGVIFIRSYPRQIL